MIDALRYWDKLCIPSSPTMWLTPPLGVFKLNFNGASHGNPGLTSFGGLCRDHDGWIKKVFMGAIGEDTNNSTELEGLI